MAERWVTMKVPATRLGIPASKISRWANRGLIQVKPNQFELIKPPLRPATRASSLVHLRPLPRA
jgi:hypothetical protein